MPLFNVDVIYRAVIHAEDPAAAHLTAMRAHGEIAADFPEPRYEIAGRVRTVADLEEGWTELDQPYGAQGSSSIRQLLRAEQPEPERDSRTIDMFDN